jgi:hypothetical protein
VTVDARNHVQGQSQCGIKYDKGLTRKGARSDITQNLQPSLRVGQMVPVEDFGPVSRQGIGRGPVHGPNHRFEPLGHVSNQLPARLDRHPLKSLADSENGHRHVLGCPVRGIDRAVYPSAIVPTKSTQMEKCSPTEDVGWRAIPT